MEVAWTAVEELVGQVEVAVAEVEPLGKEVADKEEAVTVVTKVVGGMAAVVVEVGVE